MKLLKKTDRTLTEEYDIMKFKVCSCLSRYVNILFEIHTYPYKSIKSIQQGSFSYLSFVGSFIQAGKKPNKKTTGVSLTPSHLLISPPSLFSTSLAYIHPSMLGLDLVLLLQHSIITTTIKEPKTCCNYFLKAVIVLLPEELAESLLG